MRSHWVLGLAGTMSLGTERVTSIQAIPRLNFHFPGQFIPEMSKWYLLIMLLVPHIPWYTTQLSVAVIKYPVPLRNNTKVLFWLMVLEVPAHALTVLWLWPWGTGALHTGGSGAKCSLHGG